MKTQKMMQIMDLQQVLKEKEILVGDDAFNEIFTEMTFKNDFIPRLQESNPKYKFNWTLKIDYQDVIKEAQTGRYDVVVTDLDYSGSGGKTEGYEVIDAVSKLNPRPYLILCTSCDRNKEIEDRTKGKIDIRAGNLGGFHKFDDLMNILINHFKEKSGGNE